MQVRVLGHGKLSRCATVGMTKLLGFGYCDKQRAREGLAQPRAWSEGDVSAEHCLQCEAGELAGVTRARQRQSF